MKLLNFLNLLVVFGAGVYGAPESHIIGGTKADKGEWPWQLALYVGTSFNCGGSIVAGTWGVTAAHCVGRTPSSYKIIAGTNVNKFYCTDCVQRTLKNATRHPNYSGNSDFGYPNDIAYIAWSETINETSSANMTIKYIERTKLSDHIGKNCYITGWGRTRDGGPLPVDLQEAKMNVITTSECQTKWGNRITDKHICLFDLEDFSSGGCNGDSGGPLVCEESPKKWKLVGATSWGSSSCLTTMPSVYTRIYAYNDWLDSQAYPKY
ncbi:hypothetical protein HELRODRAFT_157379 [Helobdella robusta]|uniref:Peptidase S1 domain-containing protein n=1 Tax=Helobdella robusta TaxID=6412 RepID=T1EMA5_HELRO|nr:hypothetical protein HELRODRAFT_157379 [Helobdella robusta]ESO00207.1 hypothetical protein HELRODRAFT_157379 [Helobdella robusta]